MIMKINFTVSFAPFHKPKLALLLVIILQLIAVTTGKTEDGHRLWLRYQGRKLKWRQLPERPPASESQAGEDPARGAAALGESFVATIRGGRGAGV
jgi:hypothetical protein